MGDLIRVLGRAGSDMLATLIDLIVPVTCGGCGATAAASAVCPGCLEVLHRPAEAARPTPAPPGLPLCLSGGEYAGVRRELILAYKEHGRRDLTSVLGTALALVVLAGWGPPAGGRVGPLVLVPVPSTAAATRARHGDHMLRLARAAARTLRRSGCDAGVMAALRALPKADSAELGREARAAAAQTAFAVRPARLGGLAGAAVVLLDDVLTTGATLSAVAVRLSEAGVPVAYAATLASTRLRRVGPIGPIEQIFPSSSRDGDDGVARRS
jgi:predicted amidophosphoribosyltransferase